MLEIGDVKRTIYLVLLISGAVAKNSKVSNGPFFTFCIERMKDVSREPLEEK